MPSLSTAAQSGSITRLPVHLEESSRQHRDSCLQSHLPGYHESSSAETMTLGPPNLTTLHHAGLRNVTDLNINPMQIDSLDGLTENPLNLRQAWIRGPFPNVNHIAIGFTSADHVRMYDNPSLALGGSSTM
ncbi:hypothetical protein PEX1_106370 [Penicillium expansum]|uniref:Uncharacterized protein n=1 Tax=Penicillium expansum TaxID=27334 RepID=A0A0A2JAU0_PENEN|nr:hypothetical protein PEX2_048570 [Penicillium expansum]KGO38568.1 hypothetical protein PEX1_106370 [Penicillium expansum]KGO43982.1 hypothetical protein PEXP_054660 [Penicillium expansum]KGO52469.1 hypothetical protein PEX2_048570 [Penicillium expansum]